MLPVRLAFYVGAALIGGVAAAYTSYLHRRQNRQAEQYRYMTESRRPCLMCTKSETNTITLSCNHYFHKECLRTFFNFEKTYTKCPFCTVNLTKSDRAELLNIGIRIPTRIPRVCGIAGCNRQEVNLTESTAATLHCGHWFHPECLSLEFTCQIITNEGNYHCPSCSIGIPRSELKALHQRFGAAQ